MLVLLEAGGDGLLGVYRYAGEHQEIVDAESGLVEVGTDIHDQAAPQHGGWD